MNAVLHSQISARRRGGVPEDYLHVHDLMDSTKELCSDNRHRILHTHWGIRRVIVPITGHTITNSAGRAVNVKDMCEQDHVLPDYQNRFIPTLADFVRELPADAANGLDFEKIAASYGDDPELRELLLSPLHNTGLQVSLLITHNSWFLNEMVPRILGRKPLIRDFEISPSQLFDQMRFALWMDNGADIPRSARLTAGKVIS